MGHGFAQVGSPALSKGTMLPHVFLFPIPSPQEGLVGIEACEDGWDDGGMERMRVGRQRQIQVVMRDNREEEKKGGRET